MEKTFFARHMIKPEVTLVYLSFRLRFNQHHKLKHKSGGGDLIIFCAPNTAKLKKSDPNLIYNEKKEYLYIR